MDDELEPIREELEAGSVSAQSLVLLFHAISEAEQRHDLPALEEARGIAERVARMADDALKTEAERLVALCDESVERTRERVSAAESSRPAAEHMLDCPGCGRPVAASAVRCRACGFLLV